MYEYVDEKEYSPVRAEIESIIKKVQDVVRDVMTFQFTLLGSGASHLITRIKGGNQGFDFDYNLEIQKATNDLWNDQGKIKERLIDAFRKVLVNTQYKNPENSTSVLTIKFIDQKNKKILHSADFAITKTSRENDQHYYLKYNKPNNKYIWELRGRLNDISYKVSEIRKYNYWGILEEIYLEKKNKNYNDKRSYSLYLESINETYQILENDTYEYQNSQDEDDD